MRLLPERLKNHANFPEVVGIALLLLALLALGSILSYDSVDPAYFFEAQRGESATSNWFGRVGATMAEALLQTLGTVAFLFPLGLGVLGWRRLRPETEQSSRATLVGYLALAVSLCTLLDLLFGEIHFRAQTFPAGGIIGHFAGGGLAHLLNFWGAVLVNLAVLTAVVVLISRFSFVRSVEWLARRLRVGARAVWRTSADRVSEYRARSRERRSLAEQPANPPTPPARASIPLPPREPPAAQRRPGA